MDYIMDNQNNQSLPIIYNSEHGKPVYVNNFQIYPVTAEIVMEFNSIDYKGTFKSATRNGQPTEIRVDPVVTIQLQREAAMDLLQNLARLLVPQQPQQQEPKPETPEQSKQIEQNAGK